MASSVVCSEEPKREPTREFWAGTTIARGHWAVHTATGWAPFSSIYDTGLRFRAQGGYASYRYDGNRFDALTNQTVRRKFKGTTSFGDTMVGGYLRWNTLHVKVLAGGAHETSVTTPLDEEAMGLGRRWAYKMAVEAWWDITPKMWAAFDGHRVGFDDRFQAKLRFGYKITDQLSVGPSAAIRQTAFEKDWSAGGFVRLDTGRFEWTVAGGMTQAPGRRDSLGVMLQGLVRY